MAVRGPTLFSGSWNADDTTTRDFRNGFFHRGDLFRRNPDGTVDFVDRAKYLIKTGGQSLFFDLRQESGHPATPARPTSAISVPVIVATSFSSPPFMV